MLENLIPKNKALKQKLQDKINLLENLENNFTAYKKEKEAFICKMIENHKQMTNERNLIINEIVSNNISNN